MEDIKELCFMCNDILYKLKDDLTMKLRLGPSMANVDDIIGFFFNELNTAFKVCLGNWQLLRLLQREICIFSNMC